MSTATGNLSRHLHFSEFNAPLVTGSGVLSPTQRKAQAVANLGMTGGSIYTQAAAQAVDATVTMTAANILGGIITSSTAAAVSATLPLGSALETALLAAKGGAALAVGDAFRFSVVNTGPNTFTILTNTGWTLVGNMAVATAVSAEFIVFRTAAGLYTIQKG